MRQKENWSGIEAIKRFRLRKDRERDRENIRAFETILAIDAGLERRERD